MPHKQLAAPHSLAILATFEPERHKLAEAPAWSFAPDRRIFLQTRSAGLLLLLIARDAEGQWGAGAFTVVARLRLAKDGTITVLNGKVEQSQGPRTELAMVAAEERSVPLRQSRLQMADTDLFPDDGITAPSSHAARTALEAVAASARRSESPQVSDGQVSGHLPQTSSRDAKANARAAAVEMKLQGAAKRVKC